MNGFNFTPVRAMQTETGYVTVEKDGHAMRVVPRAEYRNYASNGWKVTDPDGHVLYDPAPAPARRLRTSRRGRSSRSRGRAG